jgi:DNA mismatch endonuclease (patch repair protein)
MADNHSPQVRSYNMSRIRSKNTKPEELVRKYLFSRGLRYRKNDKRYPGKPDMIFPKYKTAVFVNGCFWHYHQGCSDFTMPKSRIDYWQPKLERNRQRDADNSAAIKAQGWHVITVWECELKKSVRNERLIRLCKEIEHESLTTVSKNKKNVRR